MKESSPEIGDVFLARSRYHLATEYRTKVRLAIEALPPEAVWWRPHESSNSIGNLILHLIGNVRQWIVSGVGGAPDVRTRRAEFQTREGPAAEELMAELDRVLAEADRVLSTLPSDALLDRRVIQGRDVTVFEAVLNVVQHFSQHVGQIIWIAKLKAPGAIQFVDGSDAARSLWSDKVRDW